MNAYGLVLLFVTGCVTPRSALVEAAGTCDSFAAYETRAQLEVNALLNSAPGDELLARTSALNAARRRCAKHTVNTLRERRETHGVDSVQHELNALTRAYGAQEVHTLLGDDAAALGPMLQEASEHSWRVSSERREVARDDEALRGLNPGEVELDGAAPELPATMCDEGSPCAQVHCVVAEAASGNEKLKPVLVKTAQRCLDARPDVSALVKLSEALRPWEPNGASTEVRARLDSLWHDALAQVQAAQADGQRGYAAQLAAPFAVLPVARDEVKTLREAAKAWHLGRAEETKPVPEAAWLHLTLAESFGASLSLSAKREGTPGRWDTARWRCEEAKPALPPLPPGVDVKLNVRCEKPEASREDDAMRTFELRSLKVTTQLSITCAGVTGQAQLKVEDPGVDGFPAERFVELLQERVREAQAACAQRQHYAQTASCADLRRYGAGDLIKRFVGHARFTHRWEPCFAEWFLVTEGAQLPPPP